MVLVPVGVDDAYGAVDLMTPARQELEVTTRRLDVLGLGQDAPAAGDHGVGAEHDRPGVVRGDRARLVACQPRRELTWGLVAHRGFVGRSGVDEVGFEADAAQQLEPARRGGGQHETRHARPCRHRGSSVYL